VKQALDSAGRWMALVDIGGQSALLVERLRDPLLWALGDRRSYYSVHVDSVGRVGEVLVQITGSRGHLPLLFDSDELEPGFVFRTVKEAVDRFGL
jgi:hypothetical protein